MEEGEVCYWGWGCSGRRSPRALRFGDGAGDRSRGHRRGPASPGQGFSHRDNTGLCPWHLDMPDPVSGVWTEVARKRRKSIISF